MVTDRAGRVTVRGWLEADPGHTLSNSRGTGIDSLGVEPGTA